MILCFNALSATLLFYVLLQPFFAQHAGCTEGQGRRQHPLLHGSSVAGPIPGTGNLMDAYVAARCFQEQLRKLL